MNNTPLLVIPTEGLKARNGGILSLATNQRSLDVARDDSWEGKK